MLLPVARSRDFATIVEQFGARGEPRGGLCFAAYRCRADGARGVESGPFVQNGATEGYTAAGREYERAPAMVTQRAASCARPPAQARSPTDTTTRKPFGRRARRKAWRRSRPGRAHRLVHVGENASEESDRRHHQDRRRALLQRASPVHESGAVAYPDRGESVHSVLRAG